LAPGIVAGTGLRESIPIVAGRPFDRLRANGVNESPVRGELVEPLADTDLRKLK